jgi:hypothetical protein
MEIGALMTAPPGAKGHRKAIDIDKKISARRPCRA